MNPKIEVKETPEFTAASISHTGTSDLDKAFGQLLAWAGSKGLLKNPEFKLGRIFHDSFRDTAPEKVRMSIFLLTNEAFEAEGEIFKTVIKKGKCIVGRFEIAPTEFGNTWKNLFSWMNENGHKKAEENPFEIYHNDFRQHPENKFVVDLCIPIL